MSSSTSLLHRPSLLDVCVCVLNTCAWRPSLPSAFRAHTAREQLDEFKRLLKESESKKKHWTAKLDALREQVAQLGREFGAELARQAAAEASAADDGSGAMEVDEEAIQEGVATGGAHGMNVGVIVDLHDDELAEVDIAQLQREIAAGEEAIAKMSPNMAAIADYQAKEADWLARLAEFDGTCAKRDAARAELDALKRARHTEFMEGFKIISTKLKEMYQMITLGGDAELDLVDSLDPFSEVRLGLRATCRGAGHAGASWLRRASRTVTLLFAVLGTVEALAGFGVHVHLTAA